MNDIEGTAWMRITLIFFCTWRAAAYRGNSSRLGRSGHRTGGGGVRHRTSHSRLVAHQSVDTEQSWDLRVCNAYAFESGLDAFHSPLPAVSAPQPRPEPAKLTHDGPLPYKWCADLGRVEGLGRGSTLSFRLSGGLPIGSYKIRALPAPGALLQLVVYRYDTSSTAADFSAHAFGDDDDPEVAIVDAYKGGRSSALSVRSLASQWQNLHFGKAINLKPGWYEWALTGDHSQAYHGSEAVGFRMSSRGKYTAIRVGVDAHLGPWYKEELVIFPTSWITVYSAAGRSSSMSVLALLLSCGLAALF